MPCDVLHPSSTPRMQSLPIREHCNLITKQYLAACNLQGHPGNKHLNRPAARRQKKFSMLIHEQEVNRYVHDNRPFDEQIYKKVLKEIHTTEVANTLNSYDKNRVLGTDPPKICQSEMTLNRLARSRLAQLRSGFSYLLNSYRNRIDEEVQNVCPLCKITPHDSQHLFHCNSNPTDLVLRDLWQRPKLVAEFFKLEEVVTTIQPQSDDGG